MISINVKDIKYQPIFKVLIHHTNEFNSSTKFTVEKSKYALCAAIHTLIFPYYRVIYLIW